MTMETNQDGAAPAPARAAGHRWRAGLVAAGAAFGLTLAGLGVGLAQTDPTTTVPADPGTRPADPGARVPFHKGPGGPNLERHMGPGPRMGMGFGIHGEFTTRAPGGGYQTLASQVGEVTEVSASSLTVKSEDGYSRTYVVNDDTLVNAGNEGIGDVKQGDRVHVMAVVKDGKANAVAVQDVTQVRALHDKWAPQRPGPKGTTD